MGQDVWMWSQDRKDPNWRLRITEDAEESGLVTLIEETTTSTAETAQTAEVISSIVMTPDDARRLHALLGSVVERMRKPGPIPCGHDEDDRAPLSGNAWRCAVCGAEGCYTAADFEAVRP